MRMDHTFVNLTDHEHTKHRKRHPARKPQPYLPLANPRSSIHGRTVANNNFNNSIPSGRFCFAKIDFVHDCEANTAAISKTNCTVRTGSWEFGEDARRSQIETSPSPTPLESKALEAIVTCRFRWVDAAGCYTLNKGLFQFTLKWSLGLYNIYITGMGTIGFVVNGPLFWLTLQAILTYIKYILNIFW